MLSWDSRRELEGMMELSYILIVVLVTHRYTCTKIHRTKRNCKK